MSEVPPYRMLARSEERVRGVKVLEVLNAPTIGKHVTLP